eukprot:CAMPEP_0113308196 /NCGR_PEP_ID=MMETSP0010_2-20120614/6728_1 /TAXON_ID=216773 ORGANISM="Corethron hystrix, Strain 308" /NCGR_SAMPLE_ID=MMETSP0010_2 /ASSEMBLY_ACC=CAM_ASM_000155 /LENGTH=252 /DNA_ID=CAMNT_0000163183 /DNA_START=199 /DNA_END=957 /DNA_ORIENTATION=- /assembly_acc=CAM_ASM_000155
MRRVGISLLAAICIVTFSPSVTHADTLRSTAVPPGYTIKSGGVPGLGASSDETVRSAVEGLVFLPDRNVGLSRYLDLDTAADASIVLTVSALDPPNSNVPPSSPQVEPTPEEKDELIRRAIRVASNPPSNKALPGEGSPLAGARISVNSLPRSGVFPYQFRLFEVNALKGKEGEWKRAIDQKDLMVRVYVCAPSVSDKGSPQSESAEMCPGRNGKEGFTVMKGSGLAKLVKLPTGKDGEIETLRTAASVRLL